MRSAFIFRIRLIAFFFLCIAVIFLVRLYFVQVVHGAEYRARAEAQYVEQSTNRIDRGTIFFTPKKGLPFSAATLATGYTVAIDPMAVKDAKGAYRALKEFLPSLDEGAFIAKAGKKGDVYEEVERRVPEDVGESIRAAKIPGVEVLAESWRFYPGNDLAAHVIGFLGYGGDGKTLTGQYGLERFYNDALTRDGGGLYVNFFADLFTNIRGKLSADDEQLAGADLITSIEPFVQANIEEILARYDTLWHPRTAGAIVMDPKTGAVIAMAARPAYDLNDFQGAKVASYSNPMVENVYEFGSIMKAITMASGIDAGVVSPASSYNDNGFAIYDGQRINNWDLKGRGPGTTMQEVLSQSLNTGAAYVAVQRLGPARFREYLEKFGIHEETGIDLPSEGTPLTANLASSRSIEYATASFGQGIAVTPIAMARALSTLANRGMVPSPHVGIRLDYGGGIVKNLGWSPPRQAISPVAADTVTRMLVTVVDTALKGGTAKIPEYSIAAKTGTAQIAKPDARGYYDDRFLHSFFGYFPAYDPEFFIFFFSVEPKGAKYASETWTDPFMETVRFLATYYNVPPDRAPTSP